MSKLERKILYHLVTYDNGMGVLSEKGIDEKYFAECKDAFRYVRDNTLAGRVPTFNEVQTNFKLKLDKVDQGDIEYLTESVRKRYVNFKINPHIEEAVKHLEDQDPLSAIKELRLVADYEKFLLDRTSLHSLKRDGEKRFADYELTKNSGGVTGIPSKWKQINDCCGGYVNGQFYVLAAFTNVGKTWALCIAADDITNKIDKDECILVVSTEMQPQRVARRIDCVKHSINFQKMRKGALEDAEEDEWVDIIVDAASGAVDYGDVETIGKTDCKNVDDIKMLVKELNPRAVLIDGGYRLQPSNGKSQDWNKQVQVIEEMQEAVIETNIPWIVTTQVGETEKKSKGSSDKGSTYHGMRYAKEWMINPDNVFLLQQDEDLKAENRMLWTNAKVRDGDQVGESWQSHWNPKTMCYDDISDAEKYQPTTKNSTVFDDQDDDGDTTVPPTDPAGIIP